MDAGSAHAFVESMRNADVAGDFADTEREELRVLLMGLLVTMLLHAADPENCETGLSVRKMSAAQIQYLRAVGYSVSAPHDDGYVWVDLDSKSGAASVSD